MGLALESIVGYEEGGKGYCIVSESMLGMLLEVANERFGENGRRIERLRGLLRGLGEGKEVRRSKNGDAWEDPQVRRERKRAEGLGIRDASKKAEEDVSL
jgi:tRNA wybutosine-synthesizing protein 3